MRPLNHGCGGPLGVSSVTDGRRLESFLAGVKERAIRVILILSSW